MRRRTPSRKKFQSRREMIRWMAAVKLCRGEKHYLLHQKTRAYGYRHNFDNRMVQECKVPYAHIAEYLSAFRTPPYTTL